MNTPVNVDLWTMQEPGDLAPAVSRELETHLAADERERWQRFSRLEDRQRFLLTRGLLRNVLATYTGDNPAALQLAVSVHGKPELAGTGRKLHFNLSHTRGLAVLAVCRQAAVGVDVERLDREVKMADLAARWFSRDEQSELQPLSSAELRHRFFAIWTCKEAYLKAIGLGLRIPLDSFSVSGAATFPVIVRHDQSVAGREVACRQWFPQEESSVALAVCTGQDQKVSVNWQHWEP